MSKKNAELSSSEVPLVEGEVPLPVPDVPPVVDVAIGDVVTYVPAVGDKIHEPAPATVTHVHNERTVNLKYEFRGHERYVASVKRGTCERSWSPR